MIRQTTHPVPYYNLLLTALLLMLLNGCSLLHDTPSLFSHQSVNEAVQEEASARSSSVALLAGVSTAELNAIKSEALHAYQPRWEAIARRSRYVRQTVLEELQKSGAPMELQLIPAVESGYDPYARSDAGATGLWQLMC